MDSAAPQRQSIDITVPLEQEGTQAVIQGWLCADGARVYKDAPLVELETDKVVMEVAAPADGLVEILLQEGNDVAPGALLGRVHPAGAEPADATPEKPPAPPASAAPAGNGTPGHSGPVDPELRLSPAVRKLLAEHGLDPRHINEHLTGTGKGGRLTREDVAAYLERDQTLAERPPAPAPATPVASTVDVADGGPAIASSVPHSGMRRRIADHMQRSVSTAPHVTAVFEADFSAIIAHRKRHKERFAQQGINLSFSAYFIAACVDAMRAVPEVNSRWRNDRLDLFRDINIGIGTALGALGDQGLIVPVVKQAQELSLLGIARELQHLTQAARSGGLKPTDVQGGTFTISNHGVSGSLVATPIIINQPQSAILGVGALEKRVVVREIDGADALQIRPLAYVSLTIDHRVIDGARANAWLKCFRDTLENWDA